MQGPGAKRSDCHASWRGVLPIHPAAELFPVMTAEKLKELGTDIMKNGLTSPIALWRADPKSPAQLLDGRNRLDALEMVTTKPVEIGAPSIMAGDFLATGMVIELDGRKVDPWAYAVSANFYRRHLNVEQRQHALITLIARAPEKSDRQLGKEIGVDHKTIANARAKGETTGEISPVEKRVGKDGKARKQPAQKVKQLVTSAPVALPAAAPINDVGADHASEFARLQARNAELEIKVKELEAENAALRAKLEAAQKAAAAAQKVTQEVTAASSESASVNLVTAGDAGPFPEFPRRKPEATGASGNSNSNAGVALADALVGAFDVIGELACECRQQVENAPPGLDQSDKIETLDETASALEGLSKPDVSAELASIKVVLLKHRKPRSRSDRLDVALDTIDACMQALNAINKGDARHQEAHVLRNTLEDASSVAEGCVFQ